MPVDLKTILNIAEERGVAISPFNAPNPESLPDAAETLGEPIIFRHAQCQGDMTNDFHADTRVFTMKGAA